MSLTERSHQLVAVKSPPEPRRESPPPGDDRSVERALVARSRAGDVRAFESVFHQHYAPLCGFAERLLRSPDAARDAVQDVFVVVWKRRESCQGCDNLRLYLVTAVRNRVLKVLRHRSVVERTRARMTRERRSPGAGAGPETPEESLGASELAAAVERIISQLPERSREAYLLHRREGLSYGEIAELMGVSVRTVENHIARALRGLREGLSDWTA